MLWWRVPGLGADTRARCPAPGDSSSRALVTVVSPLRGPQPPRTKHDSPRTASPARNMTSTPEPQPVHQRSQNRAGGQPRLLRDPEVRTPQLCEAESYGGPWPETPQGHADPGADRSTE